MKNYNTNVKVTQSSVAEIFQNKELFVAYGEETKSDLVPDVEANEELYKRIEDNGVLYCNACWCNDEMIGFSTMLTSVMPHYNKIASTVESVFVLKQYRSTGAGKLMISDAMGKAKELGSVNFFLSAPEGSSLSIASRGFGMTKTHTIYTKKI